MKLGNWLKAYRENNCLSMQDMANKCGFSKAYIGQLEKGINPSTNKPISPTIQTLSKIANAVGIEVDDFIKILDNDQPVVIQPKLQKSENMVISEQTIKARQLFSNRLKTMLQKTGMQQKELAEKLNVSESTVGKWVLAKSMPRTMGLIQQIADIFDIGKSYFLEADNTPHSPVTTPAQSLPPLTPRDERDIAKDIEKMIAELDTSAALGGTLTPDGEDMELLKSSLTQAMTLAKRVAKQKFTPKKYRKNVDTASRIGQKILEASPSAQIAVSQIINEDKHDSTNE